MPTPPVAQDITINTLEDLSALQRLFAGNSSNQVVVVSGPTNGTVRQIWDTDGDVGFMYRGNHDASGPDTFTYKIVNSITGESNVATVTVAIAAQADAPILTGGASYTQGANFHSGPVDDNVRVDPVQVIRLAGGGFVTATTVEYTGYGGHGTVLIRTFDADGQLLGSQDLSSAAGVRLSALPSGGFALGWLYAAGNESDPEYAIRGMAFDGNGAPTAANWEPAAVTGPRYLVGFGASVDDGFMLIEQVETALNSGHPKLVATYVSSTGQSSLTFDLGGEAHAESRPTILSNGDILVIYRDETDIRVDRFSVVGTLLDSSVVPANFIQAEPFNFIIHERGDGGFVVSWTEYVSTTTDNYALSFERGIMRAQVYDADGDAVGSPVSIESITSDIYGAPVTRVTMLSDGKFVMVWRHIGADDHDIHLSGQLFDQNGVAIGSQMEFLTSPLGGNHRIDAIALTEGRFAVIARSSNAGDADEIALAQIYANDGSLIAATRIDTAGDDMLAYFLGAGLTSGDLALLRADIDEANGIGSASTGLVTLGAPITFAERTTLRLNVNAELTDTDGSEVIDAIQITGAPAGWSFSIAGTTASFNAATNTWTLRGAGIASGGALALMLDPSTANLAATLKITAISKELSNGSTAASTPMSVSVTVTGVNDAATAVTFSNAVTALAEDVSTARALKVADFSVTDYDGGNNLLSLAGADAALFQIVGKAIYLKAGAKLDFETNPRLDVTLNVNDPTVGGAIDISRALVIAIRDVIEKVNGTARAETLNGGNMAEIISGLAGNDIIRGNGGNDVIIGGNGFDILSGGAGADVFRFLTHSDLGSGLSTTRHSPDILPIVGPGKRDIITDFQVGVDKIDLAGVDANSKVAGDQKFIWRGSANFTGSPGQLMAKTFDSPGTKDDRTVIYGDINGDKLVDFQLELTGVKLLKATDFVL